MKQELKLQLLKTQLAFYTDQKTNLDKIVKQTPASSFEYESMKLIMLTLEQLISKTQEQLIAQAQDMGYQLSDNWLNGKASGC